MPAIVWPLRISDAATPLVAAAGKPGAATQPVAPSAAQSASMPTTPARVLLALRSVGARPAVLADLYADVATQPVWLSALQLMTGGISVPITPAKVTPERTLLAEKREISTALKLE